MRWKSGFTPLLPFVACVDILGVVDVSLDRGCGLAVKGYEGFIIFEGRIDGEVGLHLASDSFEGRQILHLLFLFVKLKLIIDIFHQQFIYTIVYFLGLDEIERAFCLVM